MKKILFITNLPSPYRVRFFTELGKLCDLTVIYQRTADADRDEKWRQEAGGTYREIYLKGREIGAANSFAPEIINYLKEPYDHIVVGIYSSFTSMWAIRWLRSHKIPYLISTDGGFAEPENNWKAKLKGKLKRYLVGGAAGWLSTGGKSDEYLISCGARPEKIYHYPFTSFGAEDLTLPPMGKEEKQALREKLGIDAAGPLVISVGQFIPRKGFDLLCQSMKAAAEHCPEARCLIIGGEREKLEELLGEKVPANVRTLSFMSKEELFEYYRAADLFVLPTREDIWGLVVNEAMACGLPVITTDRCNAGLELVQGGRNGAIVPVEDAEALTQKLLEVLADSTALTAMGQESYAIVQGYTYEEMARVHAQIFDIC